MRVFKTTFLLSALLSLSFTKGQATAAPATEAQTVEGGKALQVPEDLQISLFANSPIVGDATHLGIDEQGRVWVTERMPVSTVRTVQTVDGAAERIVILADTDGDGLADKQTVFYQDHTLPVIQALCVLGDQVIVASGRHVFVLRDRTRNGVADSRELLLTATLGADGTAAVDAIALGADGKLYFNVVQAGLPLQSPVERACPLHGPFPEKPSGLVLDSANLAWARTEPRARAGQVVRCNLDGSEIETLAANVGLDAALAVDSFSGCWLAQTDEQRMRVMSLLGLSSSGDDCVMTVLGVGPTALEVAHGSASGLLIYEGKSLPRRLWNQFIVCDAGLHQVRACQVQPVGAGYKAESETILSSSDPSFCPADACLAPDGSIYLIDRGGGVRRTQASDVTDSIARVYRLSRKGSKPNVPPQDWGSAHGWVGALQSPNLATRSLAWSKLHADPAGSERHLSTLSRALDPYYRARAYQLLGRIKGSEDKQIGRCLLDKSPEIRMLGLRLARAQNRALIPVIQKLVQDPSPQVRRECALALRQSAAPEAPRLWAELACQYDGQDHWYLEALDIGAESNWDPFLDAWLAQAGDDWKSVAGRDIIERSRSARTPDLLRRLRHE